MDEYLWMIRTKNPDVLVDYSIVYGDERRLFSLKVHHGGQFFEKPKRSYVGGSVDFVDCCDIQSFDKDILEEMVKNMGYPPDMVFYFHFKIPNKSLEMGLRLVENDDGFNLMCNFVRRGFKELEIYVEHWHSRILSASIVGTSDVEGFENVEEGMEGMDEYEEMESEYDDDYSTDEELPSSQPLEKDNDDDKCIEDDESDQDYVVDDCEIQDVEIDLKEYHDTVVTEECGVTEEAICSQEAQLAIYDDTADAIGLDPIEMDEFHSNSDDEDERTPLRTAMRRIRKKQLSRTNAISPECPFYVGQQVDDKEHLKTSIKKYALATRRQLYVLKNEKLRFRVVCLGTSMDVHDEEGHNSHSKKKDKESLNEAVGTTNKDKAEKLKKPRKKQPTPSCPWVLLCSRNSVLDPWVVKTLKDQHTCLQERDLRQYPVAVALVEAETFNSWVWFLELLGDDLEWDANSYVTFISDRQKGLIPALAKVFPHAEHRFCLRHIHENMKKQWGGVVYKNLLWKAASATNQAKFLRVMDEIKQTNAKLYEWLSQIPAKHWARSNFSGRSQYEILLNNLCEVFNKQLVAARDKPVYTCLEYIRTYLQKRIVTVNKIISKSVGPLTPAATKLFNKIKEDASQYTVLMSGSNKYQVNGPWNDQVVVEMDIKSCTCKRWDRTGMPCRHVVAVIWDMARNNLGSGVAEKYVSNVYWLQTWKETYAHNINPIAGRDNWLPSMCLTRLVPPKHHRQIGRPKKARRKSVDEVQRTFDSSGKMTRKGATTTCGKCGKQGHNSRSCKGQGMEDGVGKKSVSGKRKERGESCVSGKRKERGESSIQELSQNAPGASQDQ